MVVDLVVLTFGVVEVVAVDVDVVLVLVKISVVDMAVVWEEVVSVNEEVVVVIFFSVGDVVVIGEGLEYMV